MTRPTESEHRRIDDPSGFAYREYPDEPPRWRTGEYLDFDAPLDSSERLDALYTGAYSRVPTYASVPRKIEYPDTDAVTVREVVDETTNEEIRNVVVHGNPGGRL